MLQLLRLYGPCVKYTIQMVYPLHPIHCDSAWLIQSMVLIVPPCFWWHPCWSWHWPTWNCNPNWTTWLPWGMHTCSVECKYHLVHRWVAWLACWLIGLDWQSIHVIHNCGSRLNSRSNLHGDSLLSIHRTVQIIQIEWIQIYGNAFDRMSV